MLRRIVVTLFLVAFASGLPAAERPARPNFVFILVDDLRHDALGVAGHPFAKTPHIDRLAREGARFRNAFVTTPLCSPSRASFLTGQYVHTNRILGNGNNNELSHKLVTFPRLLHESGYQTAYVGKWHMGNDDMPRPGFDRWVSFKGQGQFNDPELNLDGVAGRVAGGYMTDLLNEHAVEFVRRPRTKPFCLYLSHKAVHGPFTPAARHKDLFADQEIKRAPSFHDTFEGRPALTRPVPAKANAKGKGKALAAGQGSGDELIRNQLRCVVSIDEGVGALLKALEETKQLDNTLVIFTSDNGYFWGEHKLGDKRWAYEESIRIPLIMRYPKLVKAGTTPEALALNLDIAPTLLELAGSPIPREIQGRSLVPVLRGNVRGWRRSFLTEYFMEPGYPRTPSWQAVRNAQYKYIHYTELEGMDELYDLKADPYELKNLINEAGLAGPARELKAELERLLRETS